MYGFSALIILFFLLSPCFAAEFASVKKDGVNIRSGPSTKNAVLWEVFKGFPLKILKTEGQWVQTVDFEGDKGWVFSSLLSSEKTMIVKVDSANMRGGPSKDYDIIASVKKGVVFKPLAIQGNWVKVSYKEDLTGWIYNQLLWPAD